MFNIWESIVYLAFMHWVMMLGPGQIMIYILNTSNHPHVVEKYMVVAGVSCASLVNSMLTIWGLATIIITFPKLQAIIAILGALYLGYLGGKNILLFWQSPAKKGVQKKSKAPKIGNYFFTGYVLNTLNPKTLIFQLSIFSQVLPSHDIGYLPYIFGLQIPLQSLTCWSLVTALAHTRVFQIFFDTYESKIKLIFGILLIFFAGKMVLTSI